MKFAEPSCARGHPAVNSKSAAERAVALGEVICRVLRKLITARRLCWAVAVPVLFGEAPMTAVGWLSNEFWPRGRDAQSIAFFSAPGTNWLCSAIDPTPRRRWRWRPSGRSPRRVVGVEVTVVEREVTDGHLEELQVIGATEIKALAVTRLIDSLDRLPTM